MGSYKWGCRSLIWVISIVTLFITPLLTTHEASSMDQQEVCLHRNFRTKVGPISGAWKMKLWDPRSFVPEFSLAGRFRV